MAKKYLDYDGLLYFWQKIKTTFAMASHTHTKSEITDFPSTMTPSSHTHGNIQNGGTLQTTDVAVANGDKLVITDSSDSNKVARSSVSFDGSTTDKYLSKKGSWEDIPEGAAPSSTTPSMDGTASVGTEDSFARGDHVHPSDTSRVPTTRTVNGKALSADVNLYFADVKTSSSDNTTLATALGNKVDKETGKGLSTNDYTTAEKTKLSGIATGAEVNVLEGVQINGTDLSISSKKVNIPLASASANGVMSSTDYSKLAKLVFDGNDLIDSSILPSYVDDVIEAYARSGQTALSSTWLATGSASGTVITPETGKIYVLMADSGDYSANTQFRWSGTTYVKLADGGVSSITNAEIDTILAS